MATATQAVANAANRQSHHKTSVGHPTTVGRSSRSSNNSNSIDVRRAESRQSVHTEDDAVHISNSSVAAAAAVATASASA